MESLTTHGINYREHGRFLSRDYEELVRRINVALVVDDVDGNATRGPLFVRRDEYSAAFGSLKFLWAKVFSDNLPRLLYLEDLFVCLRDAISLHCRSISFPLQGKPTCN